MDELPFLAVHGGIIAKLLVGAIAGIASGAVWVVRVRGDLQRARRDVRARARTATRLSEGVVALRGVWREDRGRRWLDCGGEPVELDGEIRVLRGTRARWRWRDPGPIHRVADGDEVLAHGRLARRADDAAASYREPAVAWMLGPRRVVTPIEISALAPVACPAPLGARGVMLFAAFAVAACFALNAIGQRALAHDWSNRTERPMPGLDPLDPAVIAAALPGTRDDALHLLAHMFDNDIIRTPGTVEMSIALAGLRGCDAELSKLFEEARFEQAVARAAACGSPHEQARALLLLGRFDEAADIPEPVTEPGNVCNAASIGAGRWRAAAMTTGPGNALLGSLDDDSYTKRRELVTNHFECVAELFLVHAGDPEAAERLHERARTVFGDPCRVTDALLLPIDQQAAALTAARAILAEDTPLLRTVDLLLWTLRGDPPDSERFTSPLLEPRFTDLRPDDHAAWLAPFAVAADSPRAHAWMAVRQVYAGDWHAAHAEARAVHASLTGDDWRRFDPQQLDLEIQLREGAPRLDLEPFDEHAGFRQSTASDHAALRWGVVSRSVVHAFMPYAYSTLEPAQVAMRAAARGDGGPLAEIVERSNGPWLAGSAAILSVLPKLTHGRERLAGALQSIGGPRTYELFGYLRSLAVWRDVARASGDLATAARCQVILDRYVKMLSDRDKLIAFLLLHEVRL